MRYVILFTALLAACTPPAEPPPDVTTTVPEEPTTTTEPPEPPPPEPPGRTPEDYYPLTQVPGIQENLSADLGENANQGWRAVVYLYTNCSWALEPSPEALFPLTHTEAMDFALEGAGLDAEGQGFHDRLPVVNKRCEPSHAEHDTRFCGRSDVMRARLTAFRGRLTAHLVEARALSDALIGQPGRGVNWDGVQGWCSYQMKQGR